MLKKSVRNILKKIESLSPEDREMLEHEIARRLDKTWELESRKARKSARRRGTNQKIIDRIIEKRRYG